MSSSRNPDDVIVAEGLSKRYRLGGRKAGDSLKQTLQAWVTSHLRAITSVFRSTSNPTRADDRYIWALRDVSFRVARGEIVGIIGRNGAGKSTLLSILSRITEPTAGRAVLQGRVGSLLEIGTGFHPELTGRDNIYLNGAILGMRKAEICRKFDEIVEFAELDKFIDTPVKHYSSGMYVRLAFAVAAHLEPEVLLVDEVLAVGDAAFQKKCLGTMECAARHGRTVLFVSHNMMAVQALCTRAICLDYGCIVAEGPPAEVVGHYLRPLLSKEATELLYPVIATAPGDDRVRLRRASVRLAVGTVGSPFTVRTPLVLEFEYWNLVPGATLDIAINVYNSSGVMIFSSGTADSLPVPTGLIRSSCRVPGDLLNNAVHRVELALVGKAGEIVFQKDEVLVFEIADCPDLRGSFYDQIPGAVRPLLEWTTEYVGEPERGPGEHTTQNKDAAPTCRN